MNYRIVKRVHENNNIDDEYLVQWIDKHDDWFQLRSCSCFKEAEEYVNELIGVKAEKYIDTVVKEYHQTGSM